MHDRTALGAADVTDDELARIAADSLGLDPSRTRLLDSVASEFPYDLPVDHHRRSLLGHRPRRRRSRSAGVPGVREARAVLVPVAVLRRRPRRLPGPGRGVGAVAHRAPRLPLRPGRPAAATGSRCPAPSPSSTSTTRRRPSGSRRCRWCRRPGTSRATRTPRTCSGGWPSAPAWRSAPTSAAIPSTSGTTSTAGCGSRCCRCSGTRGSGTTPWSPAPSTTPCGRGCWRPPTGPTSTSRSSPPLPFATGHGDACPNNLLVRAHDDGFVLIDYGFWGRGADRLRPVPAAGRRHPGRQAVRPRTSRSSRRPAWRRTSTACGPRVHHRGGRGPARPCPAAADLHRLLDTAVGAPRPGAHPGAARPGGRARRPRPVQPGPGGRHRAIGELDR